MFAFNWFVFLAYEAEETSMCFPNPCQNGATCYLQFAADGYPRDGYTCEPCPSGYTGTNCEISSCK